MISRMQQNLLSRSKRCVRVCILPLFLSLKRWTRIGWKSEVSHTSAIAVGDRQLCHKLKLHMSEYVSADACSGGQEPQTRLTCIAGDPVFNYWLEHLGDLSDGHALDEKAIKAIIGKKNSSYDV